MDSPAPHRTDVHLLPAQLLRGCGNVGESSPSDPLPAGGQCEGPLAEFDPALLHVTDSVRNRLDGTEPEDAGAGCRLRSQSGDVLDRIRVPTQRVGPAGSQPS